jgi:lipid A 3-O-deacylase
MNHRVYILFLMLFSSVPGKVSAENDSVGIKRENYFRYNYDNDFFSATDRYYTQGVRLELILNSFVHNPLSKGMFRLKGAANYYGIGFERDGFTPRSIRHDSVYYGERPYACVNFLSSFIISTDQEHQQSLFSQIDLGMIGPFTRGEEEQKYIHKVLNNIQPLGWEYQIANDAVVNYTLRYEKGFFMKKHIEFIGMLGVRAGTLYDDISMGGTLRIGILNSYFSSPGLTKNSEGKKFQCYVFFRENVKAVGYNATMQGGAFNKSSFYTLRVGEINRVVGTAYAGIVIAYKRVSLEYTKAYITPEFEKGLSHGWGHCNITVCF